MTADERSFGENLRAQRLAGGLSQSQLSELTGLPKPRLSQYENDHLRPSLETLAKLAEALDIPPAALLPGPTHPLAAMVARLSERGIYPRSAAEAERMADTAADAIEEQRPRRQQRS
jgi:transcriptional regulator with XRE-family HTH domain